jgi:hypothetical protein
MMDVGTIISLVLGVLTVVFSGFWLKAKGKLGQIRDLVKEGVDVITTAVAALDDDKLTAEEIASIKKEALEAVAAFKRLVGKA